MKFIYISLVFSMVSFSLRAQDIQAEDDDPSLLSRIYRYHLLPSIDDGFDATGYGIVVGGVLATMAARTADDKVREEYRDNQKFNRDVSKFGAYWGSGAPGIAIAGLQLLVDKQAGIAHGESIAFTSLTHISLVLLTRRGRPGNPQEWNSFPSGHTASAWATATSLTYSYGWKVAIPVYTAALATMAARISDDRHWFSDTVAAAFLGLFWGRATSLHSNQSFRFSPVVRRQRPGIGVCYDF